MSLITAKWTTEEYHRMIAAGVLRDRKVELLKGEIAEMPPEGEPHAYSSDEAGEYLAKLLGNRAKIRHAKPIILPNNSEPEPDLAIVKRLGREYREHHPYPENIFWLIEVRPRVGVRRKGTRTFEYANTSLEKDLEVKNKIYAEAGIPEYWVVNLQELHLVVFREPLNGDYVTKFTLSTGTIQPLAFPDITVAIENILNK